MLVPCARPPRKKSPFSPVHRALSGPLDGRAKNIREVHSSLSLAGGARSSKTLKIVFFWIFFFLITIIFRPGALLPSRIFFGGFWRPNRISRNCKLAVPGCERFPHFQLRFRKMRNFLKTLTLGRHIILPLGVRKKKSRKKS